MSYKRKRCVGSAILVESQAFDGQSVEAAPSSEQVFSALERVMGATPFTQSQRLRQFLFYIVNETVAGRSDRIKSYSIAIEIFNKTADFDSVNDPIVRTTANRLRVALKKYYEGKGSNDPVVINLPKGRYVPKFTFNLQAANASNAAHSPDITDIGTSASDLGTDKRETPASDLSGLLINCIHVFSNRRRRALISLLFLVFLSGVVINWGIRHSRMVNDTPVVVIFSAETESSSPKVRNIFALLRNELPYYLSKISPARIVSLSGQKIDAAEKGKQVTTVAKDNPQSPLFVVRLNLAGEGDTLDLRWQLSDGRSLEVLGGASEQHNLQEPNLASNIASAISFKISDHEAGVLNLASRRANGLLLSASTCLSWAARFGREPYLEDKATASQLITCLERMVEHGYNRAEGLARLAIIHSQLSVNHVMSGESSSVLRDKAREAARRAAQIAPDTYMVNLAAMVLSFHDGNTSMARHLQDSMLREYPGDPNLKIVIGESRVFQGDIERGQQLINEGLTAKQTHCSSGYLGLAFASYMSGNYRQSLDYLNIADLDSYHVANLLRAAALANLGQLSQASDAMRRLPVNYLNYAAVMYPDLVSRGINRNIIDKIALAINKTHIKASEISPISPKEMRAP